MKTKLILTAFLISIFASVLAGSKGKIVFSNKPIDAATGESLSPAILDISEPIYCRVYLDKPLSLYKGVTGDKKRSYSVRAYLNGKQYDNVNWYQYESADKANVTTFEFILCKDESGEGFGKAFMKVLMDLPPGTYPIKIDIPAGATNESKYLAAGEFTLLKAEGSNMKAGVSFANVPSKMSNPALEAKILAYLKEDQQTNSATKGKTFLKVKILEADWQIVRNEATGVIIGRKIDVAEYVKNANGTCQIDVDTFQQDYMGGGYQEKVKYVKSAHFGNDKFKGPCDCE